MNQSFEPEYLQGSYSRQDALAFAYACDLAYSIKQEDRDNSAAVENMLKVDWNFSEAVAINKFLGGRVDTQGFVAVNDHNILIVFAGSESPQDWWANLTFTTEPGPFPDSCVHRGFQDALVPTLVRITAEIKKNDPDGNKTIWLAGHSLGGALAVLLTAMLVIEGFQVAGLYTYGAPRVGDDAFDKSFDAAFPYAYRVVNEDDVVPHLPPEFLGFSHSGNRVLFTREGVRTEDADTWNKFQKMMGGWMASALHFRRDLKIKDPHLLNKPLGYLPKLQADLEQFLQQLNKRL